MDPLSEKHDVEQIKNLKSSKKKTVKLRKQKKDIIYLFFGSLESREFFFVLIEEQNYQQLKLKNKKVNYELNIKNTPNGS